jgi:hypothetical protein
VNGFDAAWADTVAARCDRVFAAADVGFTRPGATADGPTGTLLWEADPARFAARYPDSEIVETYGLEHWPGVHCIDYWVYLDAEHGECRLSMEGWNLPDVVVKVRGHGELDGTEIAAVFARVLGVPWDA